MQRVDNNWKRMKIWSWFFLSSLIIKRLLWSKALYNQLRVIEYRPELANLLLLYFVNIYRTLNIRAEDDAMT